MDGKGRLNPVFVEWMQMVEAGWVTDVPGLSRAKLLKLLGNGVVPLQAAYALAHLLHVAGPTSQHCPEVEADLDPGPATVEV